jgi:hypothetical protein
LAVVPLDLLVLPPDVVALPVPLFLRSDIFYPSFL